MKCTNNKPTGVKLFFILMSLLFCTTVEAFIPVPDTTSSSYANRNDRSSGLRKVVDDWIAGGTTRDTVKTTYGLIQDWDTSEVTSMNNLFQMDFRSGHLDTFDADLSKWNVAKVTNMYASTYQFPFFQLPLHNLLSFFLPFSPCFLFYFHH